MYATGTLAREMATSTVEDYLKCILALEAGQPAGQLVGMGEIATAMDVAPGTVTSMVKSLEKDRHVVYAPYAGVRLTNQGRKLALHVLRRHRLIELFLVDVLGLDWSEVHEEAERLEHAMSDKLIDRIDARLGFPTSDPHGDPIPDAEGQFRAAPTLSLAECPPGGTFKIVRVSDQQQDFLRFVERNGLKPGSHVAVTHRDPLADAVTVRVKGDAETTFGHSAAAKLWVQRIS